MAPFSEACRGTCGKKTACLSGRDSSTFLPHCVPPGEFEEKVAGMAKKLSSFSPAIMGLGKSSFYQIADMNLEDALRYLQSQLTINIQTEDLREGITAFMQKRDPVWKGR